MITKIRIPQLSANVEEGVITQWLKSEGDTVRRGEPLVEITTEKAAFELESPRGGALRKILATEKSALPVGYIIALIGKSDDPLPDVEEANEQVMAKRRTALKGEGQRQHKTTEIPRIRVRATPAARRLAREHNIDLAQVQRQARVTVLTEEIVRRHVNLET